MTGRPRRAGTTLDADSRAVSAPVGFMLVFAMLVMLLGVLQVSAVPVWNEAVEHRHSEQVQADLLAVHDDVLAVAATGAERSQTVHVGLRYPVRPFLLNPPPASGTLRTDDPGTVQFSNVVADGDIGEYWDGTNHSYRTRALVYRPAYEEYANAPRTRLETGLVVNRFDGADLPLTDQGLIRGDRISLVAIGGPYESTRSLVESVPTVPVSTATRRVAVHDDGDPITIRVPTALPASFWAERLAEQRTEAGGHVRAVENTSGDAVSIVLEPGVSYELALAKVTFDQRPPDQQPAYLTPVDGVGTSVPAGSTQRLEVEVRDRFNAPVGGVDVTAEVVSGPGSATAVSPTTDADGRAVFRYSAPEDDEGTATVGVQYADDATARQRVTYDIEVYGSPGPGNGGDGGGGDGGPGQGQGPGG